LLYEDETILWRFALPRAGWWRKTPRVRLPIRPLSQSQIKREEALNTSSVPILPQGEQFPKVICLLAPLCSHYKSHLE
jgi:hypothetical protein